MPLPFSDCDIPFDVCCDTLFATGEEILDIVLPAVNNCVAPSACAPHTPIAGYVTMGVTVRDPVVDYVVVSLDRLETSRGSQDDAGKLQTPVWRALYQVRLVESNWPTAEEVNEQIFVPSPELTHAIARHSYAHGEAMFRALANAVTSRTAKPGIQLCTFHMVEPLVPVEPSGGTTGWETSVWVNINWRARAA